MHTFIELLKALLFGIVEGITEWLPVSSTGHLILLQEFVNFDGVSEGFWEMFEVVVQLGAILAVIVLFWSKIWPFSAKKVNGKRTVLKKNSLLLWAKVIIACLPAAVVGLLFDDIINELFYNPMTVGIMLALVGIAFIVIEWHHRLSGAYNRYIPACVRSFPRHVALRLYDPRRAHARHKPDDGGGIYLYPRYSRDVRRIASENRQVRLRLHLP